MAALQPSSWSIVAMLPTLKPSEFVALLNQTLEFAYPIVEIEGEILNFRISKNRWVYFDIADEAAKVHCFGTVYMLPGPLTDGIKVKVAASPRLHPLFGFTANVQSITPVGEGSIKKAADLLRAKLEKEGLFAAERKRLLPSLPEKIALITSDESAAYSDFIKIIKARWPLLTIEVYSTLVQGTEAPAEIVAAFERVNSSEYPADVIVLTRGGGSADDLAAFSDERVVRAVASSRIPTVVAIGHERDESLAEYAADLRASTPSNAAELLVPDIKNWLRALGDRSVRLEQGLDNTLSVLANWLTGQQTHLRAVMMHLLSQQNQRLLAQEQAINAYNPQAVLKRGYALVKSDSSGKVIKTAEQAKLSKDINLAFADGEVKAQVQ